MKCFHADFVTKIFVAIPPVAGAGCGTAEAEDALVETVQLLSVVDALEVLSIWVCAHIFFPQKWFDRFELLINSRDVWN